MNFEWDDMVYVKINVEKCCDVLGPLAVHQIIQNEYFTISHLDSGLGIGLVEFSIANELDRHQARSLAEHLIIQIPNLRKQIRSERLDYARGIALVQ